MIAGVFKVLYYILLGMVKSALPAKRRNLSREVVLITGGASGLGRQLAIRFAKQGVKLIAIWDVNEKGLRDTFYAVEMAGAKCWPYVVDITNADAVYAAANKMRDEIGE